MQIRRPQIPRGLTPPTKGSPISRNSASLPFELSAPNHPKLKPASHFKPSFVDPETNGASIQISVLHPSDESLLGSFLNVNRILKFSLYFISEKGH
ncbi:hypothetical protein AVEN_17884-1 [Araneus ventricosus]|uniref:Uncharacterized protein n=1 Tax=Araneus ventricosus TaxID=182803 RepID=A0A4Y2I5F7_ARAVE|nr:hypothetical protein AVEN_17884-1 [Araneus ventricosus]